jgi:diguanylate cyclase (GGDEF)-like protein
VGAYDIKNTSISSTLPGVILQANLFDNLYQNQGRYIQRVEPYVNFLLTLVICLLAAGGSFKMRSPLAGLLTTANIAVLYVLLAIVLQQSQHLWINVAMPMVCLVITTTITFMLKYFFRNQDYEKTYAMATTDSMTNLYNHRFFQDHMRRSIDQANRFNHKFSLLLIDIDFFKKFNDSYGHQAGDEVLRQVAKKLKNTVRNVDIVARYGGEEMAIVLDRANEEEALAVAQKVVNAIAEEAYPIAPGVAKHVTISCGVATYPTHGESPSELIEFSDAGLYRAKENGRNQVGAQYDDPAHQAAEKAPTSGSSELQAEQPEANNEEKGPNHHIA